MKTETKRSYKSPLREKQAAQTRELILESAIKTLAASSSEEFSLAEVAQGAGISERTLYRYFATREELMEALADWIDRRIVGSMLHGIWPTSLQDLPDTMHEVFRTFDKDPELILLQLTHAPAREVRARSRQKRIELLQKLMWPITWALEADEARRVTALIQYLASSLAWKDFRETWNLDGDATGLAVSWAMKLLFEDLRVRNAAAARARGLDPDKAPEAES